MAIAVVDLSSQGILTSCLGHQPSSWQVKLPKHRYSQGRLRIEVAVNVLLIRALPNELVEAQFTAVWSKGLKDEAVPIEHAIGACDASP